jgi:hypothetical protein
VLIELEDLAVVASQSLENAVSVEQPVVKDADGGLFGRNKVAVDIDLS